MGFVSGFAGGVTLTLGVAYLTVLTHERNRSLQALHLRSQASVLNSLLDPPQRIPPPLSRLDLGRQERSTITERAKDRWNEEIERSVRFVQNTDWDGVREKLEDAVSRLLSGGLEKGREGIVEGEKIAAPVLKAGVESVEHAAKRAGDEGHRLVNDAAKATLRGAEEAKAFAERTPELAKAALEQAQTKGAEAADVLARASHDAGESITKAGHEAKESFSTIAEQARLKTVEVAGYASEQSHELAQQARQKAHEAAVETQRLAREGRLAAKKGIQKAEESASQAWDQAADKSQHLAHQASEAAETALDKTVQASHEAGRAARTAYDNTIAKTQELAQEAPGLLESVRESISDKVHKGVENVREYVDAVKEAAASQPIGREGAMPSSLLTLSPEEKALRQRFERNPDWIDVSVEQALAARYTPIAERDNTILRGL